MSQKNLIVQIGNCNLGSFKKRFQLLRETLKNELYFYIYTLFILKTIPTFRDDFQLSGKHYKCTTLSNIFTTSVKKYSSITITYCIIKCLWHIKDHIKSKLYYTKLFLPVRSSAFSGSIKSSASASKFI